MWLYIPHASGWIDAGCWCVGCGSLSLSLFNVGVSCVWCGEFFFFLYVCGYVNLFFCVCGCICGISFRGWLFSELGCGYFWRLGCESLSCFFNVDEFLFRVGIWFILFCVGVSVVLHYVDEFLSLKAMVWIFLSFFNVDEYFVCGYVIRIVLCGCICG